MTALVLISDATFADQFDRRLPARGQVIDHHESGNAADAGARLVALEQLLPDFLTGGALRQEVLETDLVLHA